MWIFEKPPYLFLLAVIIPLIYFCHFYKGRGGLIPASTSLWQSSKFKSGNSGLKFLIFISNLSFWGGAVLLILALAAPSFVEKEKIYLSRGVDVIFVLDESPSMAALDFSPTNRFEAAKEQIRKFVTAREHDPVGLVTFSEQAALRIPPTLDTAAFLEKLDDIELMELGNGTAIGMGLAIASLHLQDSTASEKVIILITDGENNAGEIVPMSAAELASEMGIRVYTIGIGTKGEVPIEYTDRETGKVITGRYQSDFDDSLLVDIANKAEGRYFYASSVSSLDSIMSAIDSIETTEKRIKIKTNSRQYYREFIIIGALLILFDFFLKKVLFREVL
ncbi:MAG: VWA domain-containing protein [Spirochaetales bacterium]|nr:VWA domain-containing protein [Spirochaetales bacterium]